MVRWKLLLEKQVTLYFFRLKICQKPHRQSGIDHSFAHLLLSLFSIGENSMNIWAVVPRIFDQMTPLFMLMLFHCSSKIHIMVSKRNFSRFQFDALKITFRKRSVFGLKFVNMCHNIQWTLECLRVETGSLRDNLCSLQFSIKVQNNFNLVSMCVLVWKPWKPKDFNKGIGQITLKEFFCWKWGKKVCGKSRNLEVFYICLLWKFGKKKIFWTFAERH